MLQLRETSVKHRPFRKHHHVVYARKRANLLCSCTHIPATSACVQLHVLNLHVVSLGCRWVLLHSVIHPSSYCFCPGALVSARKASVFTKLLGWTTLQTHTANEFTVQAANGAWLLPCRSWHDPGSAASAERSNSKWILEQAWNRTSTYQQHQFQYINSSVSTMTMSKLRVSWVMPPLSTFPVWSWFFSFPASWPRGVYPPPPFPRPEFLQHVPDQCIAAEQSLANANWKCPKWSDRM